MLSISVVQAQQGLVVVPSSININGTAAFPFLTSTLTRTVVLNATDNITNIDFIALDLVTSDGQNIIPQQSINATVNYTQMYKGAFQQVPILFSLNGINGGQYTGEVWFTYTNESVNGSVNKIPVTATVKANAWLAILLLFITVGISYGLAYYNSKYKKGDEIRKGLELTKISIGKDQDLVKPCHYGADPDHTVFNKYWDQIDRDVSNVDDQLKHGDFDKADTTYKELTTTFNSWRDDRHNLVPLFDKFDKLIVNLNALEADILKNLNDPQISTIQVIDSMRDTLQEKFDGILSDKDQTNMEKAVESCRNVYNSLSDLITKLKADTTHKDNPTPDKCPGCKFRLDCWNAIKGMKFDDGTLKTLQDSIKGLGAPGNQHNGVAVEMFARVERVETPSILVQAYKMIEPFIRSSSPLISPGMVAGIRLFISEFLAFFIVIAILMYAGYNQLYNANPTFGASLFDWGTLALWGLMAGPGADAISQQTKTKIGIS